MRFRERSYPPSPGVLSLNYNETYRLFDIPIVPFGRHVATGQLDPNDINVVVFEKPGPDSPTKVRIGVYDEEGFLRNWPLGFFEPAEVD